MQYDRDRICPWARYIELTSELYSSQVPILAVKEHLVNAGVEVRV